MIMKTSRLRLTVIVAWWVSFRIFAGATMDGALTWQQLLEKEWLLEAQLRAESHHASKLTTRDDAAGGCDGVTNGKWGFHTAADNNPW